MVRTRIAPSPTGENLHIGNVYTGLLNYAYAKKHNGKFIIRIEDTDRTRYVEGSEERILSSLQDLGITYDEGPGKEGAYGPYRQSERLEIYHKYTQELINKGHAFFSYYNKEGAGVKKDYSAKQTLEVKTEEHIGENPPKSVAEMLAMHDTNWVVRMKIPRDQTITVHDVIRGDIQFDTNQISEQVLLKSDGYPTYHLGVVVDDHLMEISHIIRAEEWISSTPKHILLYQYFGWELPVFAHVPLLRNTDHSKLSKRKSPVWISWFLEQGYLPEALLNFLALLGWSHPEEKEIFSFDEFIRLFTLEDMHAVGPVFDLKKLDWMNGEYIREMRDEELEMRIYEFYNQKYDKALVGKTIPLIKERIKTLAEYFRLTQFIFEEPKVFEIDLSEKKEVIKHVIASLEKLDQWQADAIGTAMVEVAKAMGIKNSEFFMTLRVMISGKKISPPLNESIELLGKEIVITRLGKLL